MRGGVTSRTRTHLFYADETRAPTATEVQRRVRIARSAFADVRVRSSCSATTMDVMQVQQLSEAAKSSRVDALRPRRKCGRSDRGTKKWSPPLDSTVDHASITRRHKPESKPRDHPVTVTTEQRMLIVVGIVVQSTSPTSSRLLFTQHY
jgi:hypothetical protein